MYLSIGSNFGHQMAPLALPIFALLVGIELLSSSARVTSVKFQKGLGLTQLDALGPNRTRDTWV